jgi:hypothetical protein
MASIFTRALRMPFAPVSGKPRFFFVLLAPFLRLGHQSN